MLLLQVDEGINGKDQLGEREGEDDPEDNSSKNIQVSASKGTVILRYRPATNEGEESVRDFPSDLAPQLFAPSLCLPATAPGLEAKHFQGGVDLISTEVVFW